MVLVPQVRVLMVQHLGADLILHQAAAAVLVFILALPFWLVEEEAPVVGLAQIVPLVKVLVVLVIQDLATMVALVLRTVTVPVVAEAQQRLAQVVQEIMAATAAQEKQTLSLVRQ